MPNRVLICGGSGVGKKFVVGQMTAKEVTDASHVIWSIKNKYYRAEIELVIIGESKMSIDKATYEPYEALLILADGGAEESVLVQIEPWINLLDDSLEAQAVVVNHPSEGSVLSLQENQILREWGVKNCAEIICIGYGSQRNPKLRRAEEGTDRVCQMLECVMWPEMIRAEADASKCPMHTTPKCPMHTTAIAETKRKTHSVYKPVKTAPLPSKPAPLPKAVKVSSAPTNNTLIRNNKWDSLVDSDDDDDEQRNMGIKVNNFEAAMREMMHVREANKKEGVSWDTKMTRAENTLAKVAKALELDDEEVGLLDNSNK